MAFPAPSEHMLLLSTVGVSLVTAQDDHIFCEQLVDE